jgi:hypothetical protein
MDFRSTLPDTSQVPVIPFAITISNVLPSFNHYTRQNILTYDLGRQNYEQRHSYTSPS